MSGKIIGIDHVAITAADLEATCAFYGRVFGAKPVGDYAPEGRPLVRQLVIGGAVLSVHQHGNGLDLVAQAPTVGAGDICFRWGGTAEEAVQQLAAYQIAVVEGPVPRRTSDGRHSHSVYFRDPDGNLIELMAAD